MTTFLSDRLLAKVPRLVAPCHEERRDAIADAERPFIRQELGIDGEAVERARHDPERPQAALGGIFREVRRRHQELPKIAARKALLHALVEDRPVRRKAIRAVFLEFVRKVAARDECDFEAELRCRARDELAELVMLCKRQPREADAHDLSRIARLLQVAHRNHRRMVKRRIPLAKRARGQPCRFRKRREALHEPFIIAHADPQPRRTELAEIPRCSRARRDMKIVRIQNRMRTREHDEVGGKAHDARSCLAVGVDGLLDAPFFSVADLRHDEWRVRHSNGSKHRHIYHSFLVFDCDFLTG